MEKISYTWAALLNSIRSAEPSAPAICWCRPSRTSMPSSRCSRASRGARLAADLHNQANRKQQEHAKEQRVGAIAVRRPVLHVFEASSQASPCADWFRIDRDCVHGRARNCLLPKMCSQLHSNSRWSRGLRYRGGISAAACHFCCRNTIARFPRFSVNAVGRVEIGNDPLFGVVERRDHYGTNMRRPEERNTLVQGSPSCMERRLLAAYPERSSGALKAGIVIRRPTRCGVSVESEATFAVPCPIGRALSRRSDGSVRNRQRS